MINNYKFNYNDKGCKKFFKIYNHNKKLIKKLIEEKLIQQMITNFSKTKLAIHSEINKHKCYECRVNLHNIPDIRIAFTINGNNITIQYITTSISKEIFSKEFQKFVKEHY